MPHGVSQPWSWCVYQNNNKHSSVMAFSPIPWLGLFPCHLFHRGQSCRSLLRPRGHVTPVTDARYSLLPQTASCQLCSSSDTYTLRRCVATAVNPAETAVKQVSRAPTMPSPRRKAPKGVVPRSFPSSGKRRNIRIRHTCRMAAWHHAVLPGRPPLPQLRAS